jgi:hypothetical protein
MPVRSCAANDDDELQLRSHFKLWEMSLSPPLIQADALSPSTSSTGATLQHIDLATACGQAGTERR